MCNGVFGRRADACVCVCEIYSGMPVKCTAVAGDYRSVTLGECVSVLCRVLYQRADVCDGFGGNSESLQG